MMIRPSLLALACVLAPAQERTQEFRLATGLRCVLVENHSRPLIRMELKVRVCPEFAPDLDDGSLGVLARMLASAGAGSYSRTDFNRAADDLGLVLGFEARRDGLHWRLLAPSTAQEPAMEFLANAVFRPTLDGPALETERKLLAQNAAILPVRDAGIAAFEWDLRDPRALLEPRGAGLERLQLAGILALQQRLLRPENAVLVLYGDLSLTQARQLALLHLGVWGPSPAPAPSGPAAPAPAGTRFAALLEGGARAELWAGAIRPGPVRPELEELLAILLEGIALTPYDGLDLTAALEPGGPIRFKATGRDANRLTLVPGLMVALDLLRNKGFSEGDLERAKVLWRARNAARTLHPAAQVRQLLLEPASATAAAVAGLTIQEVDAALAAWLQPEAMRFLLLGGNQAMLQAGEKALGTAILLKP